MGALSSLAQSLGSSTGTADVRPGIDSSTEPSGHATAAPITVGTLEYVCVDGATLLCVPCSFVWGLLMVFLGGKVREFGEFWRILNLVRRFDVSITGSTTAAACHNKLHSPCTGGHPQLTPGRWGARPEPHTPNLHACQGIRRDHAAV